MLSRCNALKTVAHAALTKPHYLRLRQGKNVLIGRSIAIARMISLDPSVFLRETEASAELISGPREASRHFSVPTILNSAGASVSRRTLRRLYSSCLRENQRIARICVMISRNAKIVRLSSYSISQRHKSTEPPSMQTSAPSGFWNSAFRRHVRRQTRASNGRTTWPAMSVRRYCRPW